MHNPNDPRIKKLLAQLANRPETLGSMDVEPETDDSAGFAVEEPDQEFEVPEDVAAGVEQVGQSVDKLTSGLPNKQYQPDPAIVEMMRRLKAGEAMEPEASEEETEETIDDPDAPEDVRLAAIQKVRQKYLGR